MIKPIVEIGDPVLREPTRPVSYEAVTTEPVQSLIDDLIDTMRHADGAGIAANQIGINLRIAIIGVDHNDRYPYKPHLPMQVLVNPTYRTLDDETYRNNEGCLSVPVRGYLDRFMNIEIEALNRNGEPFQQVYRGLSAGTVQHEIDHLDGFLITDRIDDNASISTWENFRRHEYDAFVDSIADAIIRTEPRGDT